MAYPFVQLPTIEEFIAKLTSKEFGCKFETMDSPMVVHDVTEDEVSIHFLKREVDGKVETYALYFSDPGERITFTLLRSICMRLKIPGSAFGLTLE